MEIKINKEDKKMRNQKEGEEKMKTIRANCDCGAVIEDVICVDCEAVRYIGPNCGHVEQPTAVAGDCMTGEPICDDCAGIREEERREEERREEG